MPEKIAITAIFILANLAMLIFTVVFVWSRIILAKMIMKGPPKLPELQTFEEYCKEKGYSTPGVETGVETGVEAAVSD